MIGAILRKEKIWQNGTKICRGKKFKLAVFIWMNENCGLAGILKVK